MPETKLLTPEELDSIFCLAQLPITDVISGDIELLRDHIRVLEQKHAGELAAKNEHNAELQILAWQWMKAHDSLKAGCEYSLPNVVSMPQLIAELAELRAQLAAPTHGLNAIADLRRERDEARETAKTYRRKAAALDALNDDLAKLTASLSPEVQNVVRDAIKEYLEPKGAAVKALEAER